jgi:hypothetical protein
MALIPCPECKQSVSTSAANCPHCGCPITQRLSAAEIGTTVTTTELTAKKLKGRLLIALGIMAVGTVSCVGSASGPGEPGAGFALGTLAFIAGFTYWMVTRFRIWWHHK